MDSREACLSVSRARSLHCRGSFTVELFILVSRASQLTHWGALCGESSLCQCVCVCIYTSVLEAKGVCEYVCVLVCVRLSLCPNA